MPPLLTYPGVYIEEVPSGVHTITGVATSIGAFVGWAPKGPTDEAVLVQSFSDYQREFGGLDARSLLGYSVSQFFNNGGSQAYVIRLAAPAITTGTGKNQVPSGSGTATPGAVAIAVSGGQVTFAAKNPGVWSSFLWHPNRQPGCRHIRCLGGLRAKQCAPDHAGEFHRQDPGERRIDRFDHNNRRDHRHSDRYTGRRNLHAERGNGRQRNFLGRNSASQAPQPPP